MYMCVFSAFANSSLESSKAHAEKGPAADACPGGWQSGGRAARSCAEYSDSFLVNDQPCVLRRGRGPAFRDALAFAAGARGSAHCACRETYTSGSPSVAPATESTRQAPAGQQQPRAPQLVRRGGRRAKNKEPRDCLPPLLPLHPSSASASASASLSLSA